MADPSMLYCECPDCKFTDRVPMAAVRPNGTVVVVKRKHGKSHILYIKVPATD